MNILNLVQGSKEWLETRAKYRTASEAPAMMGASKFMSRDELLHMKKTGEVKPVSPSLQAIYDKGHATEEMARPIIESLIGEDLYPVTGTLEDTNLLASFDGLTLLEDIAFEHKLYNKTLALNVVNKTLEAHYYWQLEQQLLVSGAEKVIFVTSDGTQENMERMEYVSIPERRAALIAGWVQFDKDLAAYEVKAKVEKSVGMAVAELPSLTVELTGQVNNSNLAVYKLNALEFVKGINTDLQTDQDFADAEIIIKHCSKAEKEIGSVKSRALDSTVDIKTLFAELDELKEEIRQKRLSLEKTVKIQKAEIKAEITESANNKLNDHVTALNVQLDGVVTFSIDRDFNAAIKNKRTVESIQSAANDHLAQCKIQADATFKHYSNNLAHMEAAAANYKFLFNDIQQIIVQESDHFEMTVISRIDFHVQAEAKRKEDEREEMRLEEERKANAKAQREAAEQQAIIDAKAEASQEPEPKPSPIEVVTESKPLSEVAPTLAKMDDFRAKTMSVTTDNVGGFSELAAIFGEQSFGDLLYDESGNRYKLQIEVTRVAIEDVKAA